ncbi:hypothetical protein [Mycolicibacterium boenickei]|uniref:Secreted protein n=2 Tax=Mycolicibacterium boenickei TaxID=146017 RepID=A0ABN5ZCK0_9MYCO|nr:hypothetical protein [Mycolicibacterium boenickei]BBX91880.1 hypothetical protein MBOE_35290 [Mycolicibacterium boenickei]
MTAIPPAAMAALICSGESNKRGSSFCLSGVGGNEVIIGVVAVVSAAGSDESPHPATRTHAAAMVITVAAKRILVPPFLPRQI